MMSPQQEPPAANLPGWVPRQLPDNWNESQPNRGGRGWYKFTFEGDATDQRLWSVYIPSVNMTAEVYVNGVLIGSGGRMEEPLARNWFRPLKFDFSPGLLHGGVNMIYVHVAAYPNDGGGLSAVVVGHADVLEAAYRHLWAIKVLSSIVMFIVMLCFVVVIVVFVMLRPSEKSYLWLAACAFFCALFSLNFFLKDIPFDRQWWESLVQVSLGMIVYCLMMFANRLLSLQNSRPEFVAVLYFPLLGSVLMVVPEVNLVRMYEWWQVGSIVLAIYMFITVMRTWLQSRAVEAIGIALGFLCLILSGVHDWLIAKLNMDYTNLYLQFAPFAVVAVMTVLWVSRLVTVLNDYEAMNRDTKWSVPVLKKPVFLQPPAMICASPFTPCRCSFQGWMASCKMRGGCSWRQRFVRALICCAACLIRFLISQGLKQAR